MEVFDMSTASWPLQAKQGDHTANFETAFNRCLDSLDRKKGRPSQQSDVIHKRHSGIQGKLISSASQVKFRVLRRIACSNKRSY